MAIRPKSYKYATSVLWTGEKKGALTVAGTPPGEGAPPRVQGTRGDLVARGPLRRRRELLHHDDLPGLRRTRGPGFPGIRERGGRSARVRGRTIRLHQDRRPPPGHAAARSGPRPGGGDPPQGREKLPRLELHPDGGRSRTDDCEGGGDAAPGAQVLCPPVQGGRRRNRLIPWPCAFGAARQHRCALSKPLPQGVPSLFVVSALERPRHRHRPFPRREAWPRPCDIGKPKSGEAW